MPSPEAREGQRHEARGEECERSAPHRFGSGRRFQSVAQRGEADQDQAEADRSTEAVQNGSGEAVAGLVVEQHHAEHRTVARDERQVQTEEPVQERGVGGQQELGELHQDGDEQDEGEAAEVFKTERDEQGVKDRIAQRRGQGEDECGGKREAERRIEAPRGAEEGAESQELGQDDVVDQYCPHQDQAELAHRTSAPAYLALPHHPR